MKKSPKRLLALNLETIRQLGVAELRVIVGGQRPPPPTSMECHWTAPGE